MGQGFHLRSRASRAGKRGYERQAPGEEWETCTTTDVVRAFPYGWKVVQQVREGATVTSENGVQYRRRGQAPA